MDEALLGMRLLSGGVRIQFVPNHREDKVYAFTSNDVDLASVSSLFSLYSRSAGVRTIRTIDDSVLDGVARLYAEPAEGAAEPAGTGAGSAPHTL